MLYYHTKHPKNCAVVHYIIVIDIYIFLIIRQALLEFVDHENMKTSHGLQLTAENKGKISTEM